jgi:hypothetical protein
MFLLSYCADSVVMIIEGHLTIKLSSILDKVSDELTSGSSHPSNSN